jgi:hypothetical protein
MGIEANFNLWNYFFLVRLRLDSDAEVAVWGYIEIYVRTRPGIDPYFCLLVSNLSVGWRKEFFFQRNDADASVPTAMSKRTAVQPSWGYDVAKKDTHKLQPMDDFL